MLYHLTRSELPKASSGGEVFTVAPGEKGAVHTHGGVTFTNVRLRALHGHRKKKSNRKKGKKRSKIDLFAEQASKLFNTPVRNSEKPLGK